MGAPLAILGGTGKQGRGLALRFAAAGRSVVVGSRDPDKARRIASELNAELGSSHVRGTSNDEAAGIAAIVFSTLPHAGHLETVRDLKNALSGKLLVTATIRWPPEPDGSPSAAEELDELLAGSARVAAAFQTVSARSLLKPGSGDDQDVLVFAEAEATRREALAVVAETGLRPVEAGPLRGARIAEALTGLLLGINKIYGVKSAGVRITGLPAEER